jgi:hypothetical protein
VRSLIQLCPAPTRTLLLTPVQPHGFQQAAHLLADDFVHEDAAPGAERMVTRDDQAPSFIPVGDELEQHARFRVVPFDIAQVV